MELYIYVLALIFLASCLIVGNYRKRGLWFFFGMMVAAYVMLQLAYVDHFIITNGLGNACVSTISYQSMTTSFESITTALITTFTTAVTTQTTTYTQCTASASYTLTTGSIFIPLILFIANMASIISLRASIGKGSV